jgi:hypothetical protein
MVDDSLLDIAHRAIRATLQTERDGLRRTRTGNCAKQSQFAEGTACQTKPISALLA